jgi:hypothetical protein
MPLDFQDVEDQEALMWEEVYQGEARAALKLKIRPQGQP